MSNNDVTGGHVVCAVVMLFLILSSASAGGISVTERVEDGEPLIEVQNDVYTAIVRPKSGAVISSLRLKSSATASLTQWDGGTVSGLALESNAVGMSFEESDRVEEDDEVRLTFSASNENLALRKTYVFEQGSEIIRVQLRFTNESPYAITGYDAPFISNLITFGDDPQPDSSYYCMSRDGRPRVLNAASVLAQWNRTQTRGDECPWVAVADPARQSGVGIVFLDSAHHCPFVRRNDRGKRLIEWDYSPIPPGSELETAFLLVPFDGFAALSEMNERFVADTMVTQNGDDRVKVQVKFMPLGEAMSEVSIVSRAYAADGKELEPCEPLMFDEVKPRQPVSGELEVSSDGQVPAWLVHEVYVRGEKLGEFLGEVGGGRTIPNVRFRELRDARISKLERDEDPSRRREGEDDATFELVSLDRREGDSGDGSVDLSLMSGEKETLFWGIHAREEIESLEISSGKPENAEEEHPGLPSSASYTWSVKDTSEGEYVMSPYSKRSVDEDETVWVAFTIDGTELSSGTFHVSLQFAGEEQSKTVTVRVKISEIDLPGTNRYAVWYDGLPMKDAVSRKMRTPGASGFVVRGTKPKANGEASVPQVIRECARMGYDQVAFSSPGITLGAASQFEEFQADDKTVLEAGDPIWQVGQAMDSREIVEMFREKNFSIGLKTHRLPDADEDTIWADVDPDYWMVEGGCEMDRVSKLIEDDVISPDSSIWAVLDARDSDWRDMALTGRRAMWAGAWQGLAGTIVADDYQSLKEEGESAMWHVLRDVQEESAICAALMDKAKVYSEQEIDGQDAQLQRAEILTEVEELVGRSGESDLRVKAVQRGSRALVRAQTADDGDAIREYRAAKSRAIALLETLEKLVDESQEGEEFYRPARDVR